MQVTSSRRRWYRPEDPHVRLEAPAASHRLQFSGSGNVLSNQAWGRVDWCDFVSGINPVATIVFSVWRSHTGTASAFSPARRQWSSVALKLFHLRLLESWIREVPYALSLLNRPSRSAVRTGTEIVSGLTRTALVPVFLARCDMARDCSRHTVSQHLIQLPGHVRSISKWTLPFLNIFTRIRFPSRSSSHRSGSRLPDTQLIAPHSAVDGNKFFVREEMKQDTQTSI